MKRRNRPPAAPPQGRVRGDAAAIATNAGALYAARLVMAALGWGGTLLIIRTLSTESWGRFSFVFNLLALLSIITASVNSRIAIKGLVEGEDPGGHAGTYVMLRGALAVVAYSAAVSFVVLAGYPADVVRATALGGVVVLLSSPSAGYDAIFQAHVRMTPVAVAAVVGQVAQFALTVVLALFHSSLVVFTLPAVLCEVVILLWKLRSLRSLVQPRYRIDWGTWKALFKESIPLAIGSGLATVYYNIDFVLLSQLDTFRAVGIYGIAYKFANIFEFLPQALSVSLLGLLVRYWPARPDAFWAVFRRATIMLWIAAVIVVVEINVFAPHAIDLLYGSYYVQGAGAARIVVTSECVAFFTYFGMTTLVAMNRHRLYPVAALAGLVINVVLNLVLIPQYSFRGSAWATLATEILVACMLWASLLRIPGRASLPLARAARCVGAGVAAAVVAVAGEMVGPWPLAAAASLLVYAGFLHVGRIPGPYGLRSLIRDDDLPAVVA